MDAISGSMKTRPLPPLATGTTSCLTEFNPDLHVQRPGSNCADILTFETETGSKARLCTNTAARAMERSDGTHGNAWDKPVRGHWSQNLPTSPGSGAWPVHMAEATEQAQRQHTVNKRGTKDNYAR